MHRPALLWLVLAGALSGCAVDAAVWDPSEAPLDVAWPPDDPLPPGFDTPPWLTMPSDGQVSIGWWTTEEAIARVEVIREGAAAPFAVLVEEEPALLHHVQIGPLPPASAFRYSITLVGGLSTRRGVFHTPGRAGASWRFVHLGEFHAPSQSSHVARFAEAIRAFRPDLVVESGDMVDDGGDRDHWRDYLRTSRPWISNVILLPAHSNHVNGFLGNRELLAQFELPGNERWYATRHGGVQFLTLDSTYDGPSPDVLDQRDWARSQAAAARDGVDDPDFLVASWHYPACSSHYAGRAPARQWVMEELVQAFRDEGGLDLILVGHDKYYERSLLDDGVRQIPHVMANAGLLAPSAEGDNRPECTPLVTRTDTRSVVLVEVGPDALDAEVIDESGASIDRFSVPRAPR